MVNPRRITHHAVHNTPIPPSYVGVTSTNPNPTYVPPNTIINNIAANQKDSNDHISKITNHNVRKIHEDILRFLDVMSPSINLDDLFIIKPDDLEKLKAIDIKIEHIVQPNQLIIVNATTKESSVTLCMDNVETLNSLLSQLQKLEEINKKQKELEDELDELDEKDKHTTNKIMFMVTETPSFTIQPPPVYNAPWWNGTNGNP